MTQHKIQSNTKRKLALLPCAILAATGGMFSPVAFSETAIIEEIVVTARKRSESIQDVPVSVTAIDKELKEANVRRIEDVQNFDIKRIEVLRGPQGTLFGKNTTGGLINVIRGDVTMEWGADLNLTVGDDGREDIKAVVNVPVIEDQLGVKLFGASIQSDGFTRNTTLDSICVITNRFTFIICTLLRSSSCTF